MSPPRHNTGAGVTGDIEVQNLATAMTDNEDAIKHTERDGGYRKEVHGGDRFTMVLRKASHRLAGSGSLVALRIQREMVLSETSTPSIKSSP
jgi:hypothetical protein